MLVRDMKLLPVYLNWLEGTVVGVGLTEGSARATVTKTFSSAKKG